jgi:hypothetical protein
MAQPGRTDLLDAPPRRPAATRSRHLAEREVALAQARSQPESEREAAPRTWADAGIAFGLAVGAFVLYAMTAARYPVTGDTPELITVANILGVAHAPGYPLLTISGHVFGWLPIGSYALRSSLFSAVCSAACVGVVYSTARRLTPYRASAVAAAIALALTPVFWQWSLQFEVFGLANLLAGALAYLLVRWKLEPTRPGFLIGAAFVFGLAMTNHQTIAFVVPAILWLLWTERARLLAAPRVIGLGALALLGGLLPYLYVPFAATQHPALNWDDAQSAGNFYNLVTRKDYGSGFTLIAAGGYSGGNPVVRFGFLLVGIGLVVGVLALAGLVRAHHEHRWYFWFTLIGFALTGVLFQILANVKTSAVGALFVLERFFLLPLVLLAPLAALGVTELTVRFARRPSRRTNVVIVVALVAATVSVLIGALNYSRVDLSHDRIADQYARDILTGLPPNDILLANGDETIGPLWYVHDVEHVRPDVSVVLSTSLQVGWAADQLRAQGLKVPAQNTVLAFREANIDRPVDVIGALPDQSLDGKFYVYRNGLSFNLLPQAVDKSPDELAADNNAKLASYHVPTFAQTKSRSFERSIVLSYASIAYSVGDQYRQLKLNDQARTWFQRALDIAPGTGTFQQAIHDLSK